ncbi:hypothetical protein EDB85DRAFT_1941682 [Lactarius pseudohatsudake]|nr:hypothetical protein EDB85DRAFT_1941682 [Lactarius pseudohatsudake]
MHSQREKYVITTLDPTKSQTNCSDHRHNTHCLVYCAAISHVPSLPPPIIDSGSNDARVSNFQRNTLFFDLARVRCYAWGIENPHHEQRQICMRTLASAKNGIHSTRYGPTHVSVPVLVPSATWNLRVAVRTPEDAWSRCIDDGIQGCKSNALMIYAETARARARGKASGFRCIFMVGVIFSPSNPSSTSYVFFWVRHKCNIWKRSQQTLSFYGSKHYYSMTGEVLGPTGIVWGPDRKRQGRGRKAGMPRKERG